MPSSSFASRNASPARSSNVCPILTSRRSFDLLHGAKALPKGADGNRVLMGIEGQASPRSGRQHVAQGEPATLGMQRITAQARKAGDSRTRNRATLPAQRLAQWMK